MKDHSWKYNCLHRTIMINLRFKQYKLDIYILSLPILVMPLQVLFLQEKEFNLLLVF